MPGVRGRAAWSRRHNAIFNASVTNSSRLWVAADQPTIARECRSITSAT
jgi:hypothetical protein